MCWSSNIAAWGLEPDIRHGASVSKKEVDKQNRIGVCKIKAHASILFFIFFFFGGVYFFCKPTGLPVYLLHNMLTYFFFAALPFVGRRVKCPMEAKSCHQTLTPHWRPTKPAVSTCTDTHFSGASRCQQCPLNRNGYSGFEGARRPELLDMLAFCQ